MEMQSIETGLLLALSPEPGSIYKYSVTSIQRPPYVE